MLRTFSFLALLFMAVAALYTYMRQAQGVSPAPGSNPSATVNLVAVKQDLLQIARAEQQHLASDGHYLSLAEMRAAGDTGLPAESRAAYTYSVEVYPSSFTATATYSGPPGTGLPVTLHIGPEMTISSE